MITVVTDTRGYKSNWHFFDFPADSRALFEK